jgi:hypothetical protein
MMRTAIFSKCPMECYVDVECTRLLTVVKREKCFGRKYVFELQRYGVKQYRWIPTTFLAMRKSYELLVETGGMIATYDRANTLECISVETKTVNYDYPY